MWISPVLDHWDHGVHISASRVNILRLPQLSASNSNALIKRLSLVSAFERENPHISPTAFSHWDDVLNSPPSILGRCSLSTPNTNHALPPSLHDLSSAAPSRPLTRPGYTSGYKSRHHTPTIPQLLAPARLLYTHTNPQRLIQCLKYHNL